MNDDQLMDQVKTGDGAAFAELFERHNTPLVRWLAGKCGRYDLAQDIAQETWIKVHQSIRLYFCLGKFKSYLRRIGQNLLIDGSRKERTLRTTNIDDAELFDTMNIVPDGTDVLALTEQTSRLESLLPELPEDQQTAFVLFCFCGLSMQQIADEMKSPLATAKSRLRLAREKLIERSIQLGYVADLEIAQKHIASYGLSVASAT